MVMEKTSGKDKEDQMLVEFLLQLIEFRCNSEGPHFLRVQIIAELILDRLMKKTGKYRIEENEKQPLCVACSLHDIGKVAIPSEILNKPGRLDPEEYEIMKKHAMEGARILKELPSPGKGSLMHFAYQISRWHHERYDGRGYPDGLMGEEIPIAAQIAGLADSFDALTTRRVYKEAYPCQKAARMIARGECGAFNPILLECLEECSTDLQWKLEELERNSGYEEKRRETVELIARSLRINTVKPLPPPNEPGSVEPWRRMAQYV